jgi:AAA domain
MFEPIRDYVGEALARSANGRAATFDTNSGGNFQAKPMEAPAQEREWQQQQSAPPLRESQWKVGSFTAEQLQAMRFPPTTFLVEGIIPAEGVTLLCSKPKFGKSWLAYDLCIGCTTNRIILGEISPAQGDVLYLALEDSKRRLQRRMSKLLPASAPWPRNLTLKTEWRRLHEGGLDDIRAWHADSKNNGGKPVLAIIDVLAKVRKPTGNKQLYEADYEALTGLTRLAGELGLAVVVVHHTRKMASDDLWKPSPGHSVFPVPPMPFWSLRTKPRARFLTYEDATLSRGSWRSSSARNLAVGGFSGWLQRYTCRISEAASWRRLKTPMKDWPSRRLWWWRSYGAETRQTSCSIR